MNSSETLIVAVLINDKMFNPNHYNSFITASQQTTLAKFKTLDNKIFKVIKVLMECSGHFYKLKENVYKDLRCPDNNSIVVLKYAQSKINDKILTKLQEDNPGAVINVATFNTSSDYTKITIDNSFYNLYYGDDAYKYIFGSLNVKDKIKAKVQDYILSLSRELLKNFIE